MKYGNCFEAVSEAMAISFPAGLRANVQSIAEYCALVDALSEDSWSEELAVVVKGEESIMISIKCVSISTTDTDHPLFSLVNLSEGVGITCAEDGDIWLHLTMPNELLEE